MNLRKLLGLLVLIFVLLIPLNLASYALSTPAYPQSPLDVLITTLDKTFAERDEFFTGEVVYFKITVIGRTGYYLDEVWHDITWPTTYYVFVQVQTPTYEYPFLFIDPDRTINPGETAVETPGWWIPYGSIEGEYTVYVYLTSGWPSEEGVWRVYAINSTTFTVKG